MSVSNIELNLNNLALTCGLNNEELSTIDVIANIDTYSLDDIEAKLSIICVRNKVSFDTNEKKENDPLTYNINNDVNEDSIPAWIKAV